MELAEGWREEESGHLGALFYPLLTLSFLLICRDVPR